MFAAAAGISSIAMGNAPDASKRQAGYVTTTNDEGYRPCIRLVALPDIQLPCAKVDGGEDNESN